jgi:cytochrome d ubiquinol oxidase subunit I
VHVFAAATPADLPAARAQMALSLGWHIILACFGVGLPALTVFAEWRGLRTGDEDHVRLAHRWARAMGVLFAAAAVVTPPQIVIGDTLARFLATGQPAKLAAIEGLNHTGSHRPISVGGLYLGGRIRYAPRIPDGLSLLVGHRPGTVVKGLDTVPPADRPPVNPVHLSFQAMVAIGFGLLALSAWLAWSWWRRRNLPRPRWFLRFCAVAGIASVVALEAGRSGRRTTSGSSSSSSCSGRAFPACSPRWPPRCTSR